MDSDVVVRVVRVSVLLCTIMSFPVLSTQVYAEGKLEIDTKLGRIHGIAKKLNDRPYTAFLGVPYGRPPLGNKRFGKPQKIERWEGTLMATTPAKTCYYTIDKVFPLFPGAEMWNPPINALQEDCLNLNIWVPRNADGSVLVWIYGGGFFSGSPSLDLYDGAALVTEHRSIVVNINYRLGPFGFMYLGPNTSIPGNMGLLDQQLALQWVYENINSFGGERDRITLFGESAGAASVTAHLIAPGSHDFFSKVITKSGAIINSWATRTKEAMMKVTMDLAQKVNCSHQLFPDDVEKVADCLREVPAEKLQAASDLITEEIALPMTFPFVPVDEDENFFQGNVFERIKKRDFKKNVSAIVGTVKDEGTYWLPYYMSQEQYGFRFNHTISPEDPHNQADINVQQYKAAIDAFLPYFGNSPLVQRAMQQAYQEVADPRQNGSVRLRNGVARFLGDYFFTCGLIEFANILSETIYGPVYMYYFTMRSSANPWPKWMGVMHGYEIEYVFGLPIRRPQLYIAEHLHIEQAFSRKIMSMWTSFARGQSPDPEWPRYDRYNMKSLELNEGLAKEKHRTNIDVHGEYCRLIDEGKTFIQGKTGAECRARRLLSRSSRSSSTLLPPLFVLFIYSLFM